MSYMGKVRPTVALTSSDIVDGAITTDKIVDAAVTDAKVANAINTSIAANTAKVTNATHTGDVTGATALTIATDAVDIAMLSATGTASATTYLRGDNAWTTPPAGGLILVTSATLESVVATWDFLECFTSSYTNYLIMISMLSVDTNDKDLYIRFGNADLSSTTSAGREQLLISAGSTTPQYSGSTGSDGMRLTVGQNNSPSLGLSGHIWVYSPEKTGETTYATGAGQYYSDSFVNSYTYTTYGWFGGDSIESIRFIAASGSIGDTGQTARVSIYGLAES